MGSDNTNTTPASVPTPDNSVTPATLEQLKADMMQQYNELETNCKEFQGQLASIKVKMEQDNEEHVRRIEKIISLMTLHMQHIREMVELIDAFGDRLTEQERQLAGTEVKCTLMMDRQRQLASSMSKLSKTAKEIVDELEQVKQKQDSHDKFQWKLVCIVTVGTSIIVWLLTTDNFAKLIYAIGQLGS